MEEEIKKIDREIEEIDCDPKDPEECGKLYAELLTKIAALDIRIVKLSEARTDHYKAASAAATTYLGYL